MNTMILQPESRQTRAVVARLPSLRQARRLLGLAIFASGAVLFITQLLAAV